MALSTNLPFNIRRSVCPSFEDTNENLTYQPSSDCHTSTASHLRAVD